MTRKRLALLLSLALFAAGVTLVVLLRQERAATRAEAETRARIGSEARESIGRAMEGVRLCPLSDPNCNDRR
jgi:uncharacterized membrane protein